MDQVGIEKRKRGGGKMDQVGKTKKRRRGGGKMDQVGKTKKRRRENGAGRKN